MVKLVDNFEKVVLIILLAVALAFAGFELVQLAWLCLDGIFKRLEEGGLRYAPEFGKTVTAVFFSVILVLTLAKVVMSLAHTHHIKLKIILVVCLISLCRQILKLSEHGMEPAQEAGMAALALSLATSYYLVSRSPRNERTGVNHHSG